MGRHLSPRYGQVILVSGYPVLTAVNWSQHWCAICVQYQSSGAPKLARKCEIKQGGLRAVYGLVITKFSGMSRFTYPWCSAGALRAPELRYYVTAVYTLACIFVFLNSTKFLGLNHWQRSVVHFCSCPKSKGNILQKALTFPAFLRLLDIPIRRTFYSMLTTDSKGNVRAIEKVAVFLKHRV